MKQIKPLLFSLFFLGIMMCGMPSHASAPLVLTDEIIKNNVLSLQLSSLPDTTGTRSLQQAIIQFERLKNSPSFTKPSFKVTTPLTIPSDTNLVWLEIPLMNTTTSTKWILEFEPYRSFSVPAIQSITLYDTTKGPAPIQTWSTKNFINTIAIELEIAQGFKSSYYLAIESYLPVSASYITKLKTPQADHHDTIEENIKLYILLCLVGFMFGIGIVQYILSKQLFQLMIAVAALTTGLWGMWFLNPYQLLLLLPILHPLQITIILTAFLGINLLGLIYTAKKEMKKYIAVFIIVIGLNILLACIALFNPHILYYLPLDPVVTVSSIQTIFSIILVLFTLWKMIDTIALAWLFPLFVLTSIMPWLRTEHSFIALLLFSITAIISSVILVLDYWKKMGYETASLQKRLRQELKYNKEKHDTETRDWQQKLDSERVLLNELKAREQQRSVELDIARKEAEQANKAKSDFLAIISHEIRTPMNGIMGIVQLMNQTTLNEKQLEYVDVIKNSGETMLTLLNDILDYSKIEKGAIEIEHIPLTLRSVINSVAALMTGRAKDKGLDIVIDIDNTIPDHLMGDPNRLRQILLNLVSNAIKFTEKGKVTIQVKPEVIDTKSLSLIFNIIDTGMGISPDVQAKLFQPYVQADASISRRFGGTGLGLNICRMLINAMNGSIGLESELGKGSRFWFKLDYEIAPDDIAIKTISTEKYQATRLLNILVIDDNSVNLKVVQGLLEMDGHSVTTCSQAQHGLKLVDEKVFDLIFVDLLMPGMDGKAFALQLRKNPNPHIARTPIYALTGMGGEIGKQAAESSGMQGVLTKPITQPSLRAVIESIAKAILSNQANTDYVLKDIINKLTVLTADDRDKLTQAIQSGSIGTKELYDMIKNPEEPSPISTAVDKELETLNHIMLSDLKNSLPATTLKSLFDELIPKSRELLDELEIASKEKNIQTITERAHNLKGMCGNFGLEAMMKLCGEIESFGHKRQDENAYLLIQKVRPTLDRTLKDLEKWFDS